MKVDGIKETAPTEPKRRNFLKFLVLGGGLAVAGGVLNSLKISTDNKISSGKDTLFSGFRVTENSREVAFYSKEGDELLVIEKER